MANDGEAPGLSMKQALGMTSSVIAAIVIAVGWVQGEINIKMVPALEKIGKIEVTMSNLDHTLDNLRIEFGRMDERYSRVKELDAKVTYLEERLIKALNEER